MARVTLRSQYRRMMRDTPGTREIGFGDSRLRVNDPRLSLNRRVRHIIAAQGLIQGRASLDGLPMNGARLRWEGEASAEPRRFAELGIRQRLIRRFALPVDPYSSAGRTSLVAVSRVVF
jgi:hypothetical protein